MLKDYFLKKVIQKFDFELTNDQLRTVNFFADFLFDELGQVFILNGYAGTGKTTFIKSVVQTLNEFRYSYVLLAPTGRAAKVLSNYCNHVSNTIHKHIYKQKSATDFRFILNYQVNKNTIFFVDEASLISNDYSDSNIFGSGRLLDDLLEYVFKHNSNKLVFIGDSAQLPPVGSMFHPALEQKVFESVSLKTYFTTLTEVVRQQKDSDILLNATSLRQNISNSLSQMPNFKYSKKDFEYLDSNYVLDAISSSYDKVGLDETIILTYSNKRALQINRSIRNQIFGYDGEVVNGECLMVVKNNYMPLPEDLPFNFIANGEMIFVNRILKEHHLYDFRFLKSSIKLANFTDVELECLLLLDTLHLDSPSLNKEEQDRLFYNVLEDYKDIKSKKKQMLLVRENQYFNAIQVKYAYAVTAHKAQGGQWKHVYIDASFLHYVELKSETLKWFYTAITRATEKLFLFGLPDKYR